MRRSGGRGLTHFGVGLAAALFILLTGLILGLAGFYSNLTADLPSLEGIPAYFGRDDGAFYNPTRLLDRSGAHVLLTVENPGIQPVYLVLDAQQEDHLSGQLARAAAALLQEDFWQSPGFDVRHLADPTPHTIAERLVSDLLLSGEPTGLRRALRMRLLAAQAVAEKGREQILEWYLNEANFGHRAFGAEAAARLYFEKSAADLNLAEAVMLVATLEAPVLNPLDAPAAARERWQAALLQMRQSGALDEAGYTAAVQEQIRLRTKMEPEPTLARAFTRLVLEDLGDTIGRERVERGGWTIRTTLDYDLQVQLVCTLQEQLKRLESGKLAASAPADCPAARLLPTLNLAESPQGSGWTGSALMIDPQTGQILALAGETTPQGETDALSAHPAGTILTPLAAVGLFAGGYSPASLVWDLPANRPTGLADADNPDGEYHGPQRLRNAIANDYLAGISSLLEQSGAASIWRRVEPLGLGNLAGAEDPLAVIYGAAEATVLQISRAYAPLANGGVQVGQGDTLKPALILEVKKGGDSQPGFGVVDTQPLISPQLAYLVQNVLSDETARRASLGYPNPLEIGRPAGAKLGQTAAGDDIWAAGFTPQRLAVVHINRKAAGNPERLDARLAAGTWYALMQTAGRDLPPLGWEQPAGIHTVDVCDPSGLLPTAQCPTVVKEIFLAGNEPTAGDDLYRVLQVNRETGLLATIFTPAELVEQRTYFVVPPEAQEWASDRGLPQPPTAYDRVQAQVSLPGVEITAPAMFAAVSGEVEIRGTADTVGLQRYSIQVGQGMNPTEWVLVGEGNLAVKNGVLADWQTPQEDGLYAIRLLVVGEDLGVKTAAIQVTVDNTPPEVRITRPAAGETIHLDGATSILLGAQANDALGIRQTEWLLDGRSIGIQQGAPTTLQWQARPGAHTLMVRVTDLAGNVTDSQAVGFIVSRN